jgi:hypothetical protein
MENARKHIHVIKDFLKADDTPCLTCSDTYRLPQKAIDSLVEWRNNTNFVECVGAIK